MKITSLEEMRALPRTSDLQISHTRSPLTLIHFLAQLTWRIAASPRHLHSSWMALPLSKSSGER